MSRVLLDTHTFLWWLTGDARLSQAAVAAIGDERNEIFVSSASAWEISTKYRNGKLPEAAAIATDIESATKSQGFNGLPVNIPHSQSAGALPGAHRDPFDRMLVAQSKSEPAILVTGDALLGNYGETVWVL